jgi:hypothetical protein
MNTNNRHFLAERIVFKQAIAFMAIMTFIFFNEVYNLSGRLIGAPSSSNLLTKLIFDGVFVAIVGLYIVKHTQRMLRRMKNLEGIAPVCSACKKTETTITAGTILNRTSATSPRRNSPTAFARNACRNSTRSSLNKSFEWMKIKRLHGSNPSLPKSWPT